MRMTTSAPRGQVEKLRQRILIVVRSEFALTSVLRLGNRLHSLLLLLLLGELGKRPRDGVRLLYGRVVHIG